MVALKDPLRLEPLGVDRHWTRYWSLPFVDGALNAPAVYVEQRTPLGDDPSVSCNWRNSISLV